MTDLGQNFIMNAIALEIIKKNLDATNFNGLSVKALVGILPVIIYHLQFHLGLS